MLANNQGTHLGTGGQDQLWQVLDDRGAVVLIRPADLPAPAVENVPPFAADFLLDTTRAADLLVRSGIVRHYPNIRFILSHAGGLVPYASHRLAVAIASDTGRSPLDILEELRGFYFDTALSSSLDAGVDAGTLAAVNRTNAEALFPRLGGAPVSAPVRSPAARLRQSAQRAGARLFFRLVQSGTR
ncbi:amidohydrolase family protein [Streptomyces sp. NPDC051172]|uniref:amidohydrolase family protein n=1 Tax=Streptomyces sp. NPDC051172 TaxID=3155796 RepID=UPI003423C741